MTFAEISKPWKHCNKFCSKSIPVAFPNRVEQSGRKTFEKIHQCFLAMLMSALPHPVIKAEVNSKRLSDCSLCL
jgi:hypothetical protein